MNIYLKEPQQQAQACIIWMHGLGADASDMAGLAEQLMLDGLAVRHVFMDAPIRPVTLNNGMAMPAWYDITGVQLTDREDREGIVASQALITEVIETLCGEGFSSKQIFLAGFSQGGAMALYTGLHYAKPLAGIISLSAYLPLATELKARQARDIPVFIGAGRFDPLVLPQWTQQTVEGLKAAGYNKLSCHDYPMEHAVCIDEIKDLSQWLTVLIKGAV